MLQEAISYYQKNDIKNALIAIKKHNNVKYNQSFVSLQLEAVCLAKQGEFNQAKEKATLSLQQPHTKQEKVQGETLVNNIDIALTNSNLANIKNVRCGDVGDSIFSDNEKSLIIVKQLIEVMESMGATFHKDIRFICEGGNLSIQSSSIKGCIECQISVPLVCMPLLSDYSLSVINDKTVQAEPKTKMLNKAAAPIMQLLIELYNVNNKVESWKNSFAFLALPHYKSIFDTLLKFRPSDGKIAKYKGYFDNKQWAMLLLDSFFGAREFTYQQSSISESGIHFTNNSEKGLLGIIDFLNHKVGPSGYQINKKDACMNIVTEPDKESKELFVQYGVYDPIQTFLIYGFADQSSPFLYSGKMDIPMLSGNTFSILSMSGKLSRTQSLPNDLLFLKAYLPAGIKKQGKQFIVSDIIIPRDATQDYLKKVLEVILTDCDDNNYYQDKTLMAKEVAYIETEIVRRNRIFWETFERENLQTLLQDKNLSELIKFNISSLSSICLSHLSNYK